MNKKTKIVASAAATIAMCASLAVGGTFALFTSESKVNVTVSSGKVKVVANANNLTLHSPTSIGLDGVVVDDTNAASATAFTNGGTASITDGNVVELYEMTPGDSASFDIVVTNESSVTVQYQTKLEMLEGIDLFSGLRIMLKKGEDPAYAYDGMTAYSQWATLTEQGEVETTKVTIELPADAGNQYQGRTCKLAFTVNAVQGNTEVMQPEANVTYLYNASDLRLFEKSVNGGNTYAGKTVKLMNDVDLARIEWNPVGQTRATQFQGIFNGQGKTISNMTVNNPSKNEHVSSGFFGWLENTSGVVVKDVKFDKANVTGSHYVGVVAGYLSGTITGCEVKGSTVNGVNMNSEANGDKVGGIVGYINAGTVSNNTVTNCSVIGNRDIGGIVGAINAGTTFTGNAVSDTEIAYETEKPYGSAGAIVSGRTGFVPDSTNTDSNVTVINQISVFTAENLSAALNNTYSADMTIKLMNDITLSGEWGAHALNATNSAALIIDGNGKTINGLTSTNYYKVNGFNSNGLVTSIGAGFSSVTFKNLTVSGAKLENDDGLGTDYSSSASGVFVGDTNTVNVTFDSCTVIGAKINSYKYAGGFIGYAQDVNDIKKTITFNNCVVIDSEINTTDSSVGGLVGHNYTKLSISGCQIKGHTTIKCAEDRMGSVAKAGYLIGTVNGGSATISNITVESTVELDTMDGTTYDTTKYVGRNYGTVSVVTANS